MNPEPLWGHLLKFRHRYREVNRGNKILNISCVKLLANSVDELL